MATKLLLAIAVVSLIVGCATQKPVYKRGTQVYSKVTKVHYTIDTGYIRKGSFSSFPAQLVYTATNSKGDTVHNLAPHDLLLIN
jgi:hypothetical protein